jgi:hypothetical protein
MSAWYEQLRPLCEEVSRAAPSRYRPGVVLFYLARWFQKKTQSDAPRVDELGREMTRKTALEIARNLVADGETVERLVGGDAEAWNDLSDLLLRTAVWRLPASADELVDSTRKKIAVILLTGTPPSQAAARLLEGPEGPSNEYLFTSPFRNWARAIVIHEIIDETRRIARQRAPHQPRRNAAKRVPREKLAAALGTLPDLLQAIDELPGVQRTVMTLTLSRNAEVYEAVQRVHPGLLEVADSRPASDTEIAAYLGTTPHRVAANRSAARRKLVGRDPGWEILLDELMPHATTRPVKR